MFIDISISPVHSSSSPIVCFSTGTTVISL
jgi:hypothetical protein